jgi:hypothetical protein
MLVEWSEGATGLGSAMRSFRGMGIPYQHAGEVLIVSHLLERANRWCLSPH